MCDLVGFNINRGGRSGRRPFQRAVGREDRIPPEREGDTFLDRHWLFATETFVWGLQGMCHLQRIPFAPNLVLQQVAPPYDLNSLQQAAETLGLKAGVKQVAVADLANLPWPCLAVLKPAAVPHPAPSANEPITPAPTAREGEGEGEDNGEIAPPPPYRLALVLKARRTTYVFCCSTRKAKIHSKPRSPTSKLYTQDR